MSESFDTTNWESQLPNISDIRQAHEHIKPFIHCTPVMTCSMLNQLAGATLFFKCENFQKTGSFKIRGATNAVSQLSKQQLEQGVATHSSGNHGAALALAAASRKARAYIVMPSNAPEVKKKAVLGYGAKVIECEPTLQAREETLNKVVEDTGATFIHPYNHPHIIAGQGTACIELLEEVGYCDYVIPPVGGGGLLSGTAIAAKALFPDMQTIAAEPSGADDAYRSFHAQTLIPSTHPNTIADGLLTSLGKLTFSAIRKYVADILTVDEDMIRYAMRLRWERMKIVVEPSGAVPFGVVMAHRKQFEGKRIGIIISGGNIDLGKFKW